MSYSSSNLSFLSSSSFDGGNSGSGGGRVEGGGVGGGRSYSEATDPDGEFAMRMKQWGVRTESARGGAVKKKEGFGGGHGSLYDTLEARPGALLYREGQTASVRAKDLLAARGIRKTDIEALKEEVAAEEGQQKNLFGSFEGVFARCLLNIWGVLMFLRLGWIVGHAGVWYSCLIVVVCMTVTSITTSSLSAICTNGEVKSGGAYFMISRSLGPEFGGAIGILFSLANAGAVALHLVGFAETVTPLYPSDFTGDETWDLRVIAIATLVFLICIALVGVGWVVKFQLFLLFLLCFSILSYVIGTFLKPDPDLGYTGYDKDTLGENMKTRWTTSWIPTGEEDVLEETFFTLFAVFFPASTGIMAGANISGDLKDAQKAIPKGTFAAVGVSGVVYIILIWMLGTTLVKEVVLFDGVLVNSTVGLPLEIAGNYSLGGLLYNNQIMIEGAFWGPLIVAGIFAAGLSSALAALVGAPRVFQAVCQDNLFPVLQFFAKGRGANNEPVRAYVLTFVIAFGFILIGNLNQIAPLITNFFMISYALINYACFAATWSQVPGWRPSFKYFNAYVALFGVLCCIVLMFIINYIFSLVTFIVSVMLYKYVDWQQPDVNWGSARQAKIYLDALNQTARLERVEEHVKTYRPAFLVLTEEPEEHVDLIKYTSLFANISNGVMHCGNVVLGEFDQAHAEAYQKARLHNMLLEYNISGFVDVVITPTLRSGYQLLLQSAGVGKLRPNIAAMPFPKGNVGEEEVGVFVGTIRDAFMLDFGVCVSRGLPNLEKSAKRRGRVDVWWLADDGGLTLLMPWLLLQNKAWKGCTLRLITGSGKDSEASNIEIVRLLEKFRISGDVMVVDLSPYSDDGLREWKQMGFDEDSYHSRLEEAWVEAGRSEDTFTDRIARYIRQGELVRQHSTDAEAIFVNLPLPRNTDNDVDFLAICDLSTEGDLPPIMMVRGNGQRALTYYS